MNLYSIYFTCNGQVVRLPHNPSELSDEQSADNGQYNVLGKGPLSLPRKPGQRELSISGYFPGSLNSSLSSLLTYRPPEYYIQFFRQAMDAGDPVLYTPVRISQRGIPYAMGLTGYYVLIDKFNFQEKGGEPGDFYYELEASEYRDPSPSRVVLASDSSAAASAGGGTAAAASARLARSALPALAAAVATTTAAASAGSVSGALRATVEPSRQVDRHQLVVGSQCTLSGSCWSDAEMGAPETPVSGQLCTVVRICGSDLGAPVYVKDASGQPLGWTKRTMLTIRAGSAALGR